MAGPSVFKSTHGRDLVRDYYHSILARVPVTQRWLDTSFGRTFLLEAGPVDAPPLILLHGSCSNSAAWFGDLPALAACCHVFAVDLPGEPGNSQDRRLDLVSGEYIAWLAETMDALALPSAVIMGNSLGGWLALHFAATYPRRTRALILLAPSGILAPRESFLSEMALIDTAPDQAAAIGGDLLADAGLPPEVLAFMNLILEHFIPLTDPLPILSDDALDALTLPLLFIAGTGDATMDQAEAARRLISHAPQAQIHLDQGGHIITTAADLVLPFLAQVP